jgi:hypothetical protein
MEVLQYLTMETTCAVVEEFFGLGMDLEDRLIPV